MLLELLGQLFLKRDIFDTTIYKGFTEFGLVDFYANIMFVSLHKIGLIWKVNSSEATHEDFVLDYYRKKLMILLMKLLKTNLARISGCYL